MEKLLVKLMILAALAQFGMTIKDLENCRSRQCLQVVEKHSLDILKIEWKPISVFPEEAKRFRKIPRNGHAYL